MNLRAFLQSQGLSAKDIDEAVREARRATRVVRTVSGALVEVLTKAATRVENEKVKKALGVGAVVSQKVQEGADTLLRKR